MKFSRIFWPLLFCTLLAVNPTAAFADKTMPTIMVLGDSLSAAYGIDRDKGWVALLEKRLTQTGYRYRVINASVSGDTTRTGLGRLDAALDTHRPQIVIVELGANDGLRGLPFKEIESSLVRIIEKSQQAGARVLLVGVRLPPNYGEAYNREFLDIYRKLAGRFKLPLVPKMLDQVSDYRNLLQEDGMHPIARAEPKVLENIWVKLQPMLK
jgi:acyl-CoA thioesterase-1